jgi:hypothetical protein
MKSFHDRIDLLLAAMVKDTLSTEANINTLKLKIFDYTYDPKFKKCNSMGAILKHALEFLTDNYENVNPLNLRQ